MGEKTATKLREKKSFGVGQCREKNEAPRRERAREKKRSIWV